MGRGVPEISTFCGKEIAVIQYKQQQGHLASSSHAYCRENTTAFSNNPLDFEKSSMTANTTHPPAHIRLLQFQCCLIYAKNTEIKASLTGALRLFHAMF